MVEILKPGEGDESPLIAAAYPVTRVYCDGEGIVCFEREGFDPIRLNQVSPKGSRQEALRRCISLLDSIPDEHSVERDFPISMTGKGLTYNQLKKETYTSCLQSRDIEAKRTDDAKKKRRRYRS